MQGRMYEEAPPGTDAREKVQGCNLGRVHEKPGTAPLELDRHLDHAPHPHTMDPRHARLYYRRLTMCPSQALFRCTRTDTRDYADAAARPKRTEGFCTKLPVFVATVSSSVDRLRVIIRLLAFDLALCLARAALSLSLCLAWGPAILFKTPSPVPTPRVVAIPAPPSSTGRLRSSHLSLACRCLAPLLLAPLGPLLPACETHGTNGSVFTCSMQLCHAEDPHYIL
jgi:hypothetical protein